MTSNPDEALWQAASDGDLNALTIALSAGAKVTARGRFGDTALNLTAENGHLAVVERLPEAGADIENVGAADKTPLMNAAFAGQTQIVQLLLQQVARISYDLLSSLQMKVNVLEENADAGMVNPEAAEAWRKFLEYLIAIWEEKNPHENRD